MAGHGRRRAGRGRARDPLSVPPPRGPRPPQPHGLHARASATARPASATARPASAGRHRAPRPVRLTRRGRLVIGVVIAACVGTGSLAAAQTAAPASTVDARTSPPLHVSAASPHLPALPAAATAPAVPLGPGGVPVAVAQALATAGGSVSVAVYDAVSGRSWSANDHSGQVEASVSKLQILGAWLRAEQAGRAPSARDDANLRAMIVSSSNPAADAIFAAVGRGGLSAFTAALGVPVRPGSGSHFGLDTSSAAGQVTIMRAFAYHNAVLSDSSRAQAHALLEAVQADQHWGVSGGVPPGVDVDLKNGWLPLGSGWVVNSVGHVSGAGHDYVVAILSSRNASERAGIARLQAVSAAVWSTSAARPSAS